MEFDDTFSCIAKRAISSHIDRAFSIGKHHYGTLKLRSSWNILGRPGLRDDERGHVLLFNEARCLFRTSANCCRTPRIHGDPSRVSDACAS